MSRGGGIPAEALLDLRRRLDELSPRHRTRRVLVEGTAELFRVSRATVYRALAGQLRTTLIWIDPVKLPLRFSKSPPSMCWIQGATGMISDGGSC